MFTFLKVQIKVLLKAVNKEQDPVDKILNNLQNYLWFILCFYYEKIFIIGASTDSISNFYYIGSNGMHKYNNQDNSMLTAFRAAELVNQNNLSKSSKEKLWLINTEEEYHEQK